MTSPRDCTDPQFHRLDPERLTESGSVTTLHRVPPYPTAHERRGRSVESFAVIFDCDGVLVDSEILGAQVAREMALEAGIVLTAAEALAMIRGRKVAVWVEELQALSGGRLPPDFVTDFRCRSATLFRSDLKPVPHVESVLRGLDLPFCTASSAPREKIELTLKLTGLFPFFVDRIFSAYEIGSWKPDPGLFLHASAQLGVPPSRCAVIEDSLVGVLAARAAGMTVFGYGSVATASALAHAGATVFDSMLILPDLLHAWRSRFSFTNTTPASLRSPHSVQGEISHERR